MPSGVVSTCQTMCRLPQRPSSVADVYWGAVVFPAPDIALTHASAQSIKAHAAFDSANLQQAGRNVHSSCCRTVQVFSELAGDNWSNKDALRSCIGDINADTNNDMMQASPSSMLPASFPNETHVHQQAFIMEPASQPAYLAALIRELGRVLIRSHHDSHCHSHPADRST